MLVISEKKKRRTPSPEKKTWVQVGKGEGEEKGGWSTENTLGGGRINLYNGCLRMGKEKESRGA